MSQTAVLPPDSPESALQAHIRETGLELPALLARQFPAHQGEFVAATFPTPNGMSFYTGNLPELFPSPAKPTQLVAHAGHGINSYLFGEAIAQNGLLILVQTAWKGVYMNDEENLAHHNLRAHLIDQVVEAAATSPHFLTLRQANPDLYLLIVESDFYPSYWGQISLPVPDQKGPQPDQDDYRTPGSALRAALAWLENPGPEVPALPEIVR